MRKLIYYIACTADGFIARADGSFDFFPLAGAHFPYILTEYPETIPAHLRARLGVEGANKHFDAVVMGRHTYDVGATVGFTNPYPQLRQYVVSATLRESPDAAVQLAQEPLALVRELKQQDGLGIWLCGGAALAGALYDELDELILKVNPVVLGTGIPLFRGADGPLALELVDYRAFDGGVAIQRYSIQR